MRDLSEEFLREQLPDWPDKAPPRPARRPWRAVLAACGAVLAVVVVLVVTVPAVCLSLLAAPAAAGWVLVIRQSPRSRLQRARHGGRRR
jgi:CBS-domain-containing membrane protein